MTSASQDSRSPRSTRTRVSRLLLIYCIAWAAGGGPRPEGLSAQGAGRLFPDRALLPNLLAGAREPTTSFSLLAVSRNPDAFGTGVEVEASIGSTLPVLLLAGEPGQSPVVVGVEAAAFARFGLQVLERELIASDWVFALPVVWDRPDGWIRFRYYHSSSHIGDEYARRFEDPGVNFSRDAAELLALQRPRPLVAAYAGARYAYNVHPEESRRWVLRAGLQVEGVERHRPLRPFAALDLEWDADAGWGTRVDVRSGIWLPEVAGRRALRACIGLLAGPSPLGQFNRLRTTQFGLSLQGIL